MFFESWSDFFNMGGYGLFVWLAFGVSLFSLLALWGQTLLTRRKIIAEILEFGARKARRKEAKSRERLL